MLPGEVVDNRFELDRIAGAGAMGQVYRAIDRSSGEAVAVKVLHSGPTERFVREVRVLAALRHPGIVRYIADGQTASGELWLAMEWLDGENLAERLARSGLTAQESVELARRVAEALGAAHERHVVHRDVKPSNLFLPGGDLERVKVLDFGVARVTDGVTATRTGVIVGTPAYMAPEQVRGEKEITARADVFAVGSVLFECLTGRPPFAGETLMAVLAKIAMEDPPRLAERRPELPDALDRLVGRLLAKQVEARPRDGLALAAELAALGHIDASDRPVAAPSVALTATERRLLSVVLIAGDADAGARTLHDGATQVGYTTAGTGPESMHPHETSATRALGRGARSGSGSGSGDDSLARTSVGDLDAGAIDALRAAAELYGARLERLLDGSYVVTLAGTGGAADQVMQAARCALALKAAAPQSPMALATGRGMIAGRWPVGEAIDRAAKLLVGAGEGAVQLVRLDEVTAGLLDRRFVVGGDDAGLYLIGERDVSEVARTLLGKETPCVGRDRELAVLDGLFAECVTEPIARAVLVTGAEGVGKSRVRYELLRRIAARAGEPVEIWIGRGEPMRAGSPFGMIAPALRRAAGILDGEPVDVSRRKLRARVLRNASTDLSRTIAFLGELIGAPFPDDASVELRAARQDPLLMVDQIRRAFEHFLGVETAAQPVVIVLEDLHWGDLPTVQLIDSALRGLADRPWMVLALARPDLHDQFPRLWGERGIVEVKLELLKKKGSEQLVRKVLGDRATDELVARLVDQSGGNAFYLEELIRAVAEGKGDAMPETVLAVVQGRLERLEVDARRILRAASVFGQQFWRGGVAALLGGAHRDTNAHTWIDELVARELVSRAQMSRFPGEDELSFRHAMVREAAYAMLTEADRRLGHQLAGDWLEKIGEPQAVVLAEHFERGGEPGRAIGHYRRAAEQALVACDYAAAIARAERAVACGAREAVLGALRAVQAEAHRWRGELGDAAKRGVEAMGLLDRGSPAWFAAAGEVAEASGKLADFGRLATIGEALRVAPEARSGEGVGARVTATAQTAFQLYQHGNYELANALLDRIEKAAIGVGDPGVLARVHQARSSRAMFAGDAGAYLVEETAAAAEFERAGDLRYACMQRGHVGYACLEIGAYAEGERWLRDVMAEATRMGLSGVVATAKHNLGRALQRLGNLDEALAVETEAVEAFTAHGDVRLESAARVYLATILADLGALDRAEQELALSLSLVPGSVLRYQILANQARLLLRSSRTAEAYALAREASDGLDQVGIVEEGEALIRLMLAETLAAAGELASARDAAARARARILERAMQITDPARRRQFLEQVPENARTLALADQLGAR